MIPSVRPRKTINSNLCTCTESIHLASERLRHVALPLKGKSGMSPRHVGAKSEAEGFQATSSPGHSRGRFVQARPAMCQMLPTVKHKHSRQFVSHDRALTQCKLQPRPERVYAQTRLWSSRESFLAIPCIDSHLSQLRYLPLLTPSLSERPQGIRPSNRQLLRSHQKVPYKPVRGHLMPMKQCKGRNVWSLPAVAGRSNYSGLAQARCQLPPQSSPYRRRHHHCLPRNLHSHHHAWALLATVSHNPSHLATQIAHSLS